jgi:O-antigen ligase
MTAAATEPNAAPVEQEDRPTRWLESVFIGLAVLTPPIYYLSHLALAVLVSLSGLLCLPFILRSRKPMLGLAILLALTAWALASMSWSLYREPPGNTKISIEDMTGLKMLLELGLYGAFVCAALNLSRRSARLVTLVFAIGLMLLAALFLAEGLAGARLYAWLRAQAGQPVDAIIAARDVKRLAYLLAVLFWPVAIWLEGRKLWWAAIALAAATTAGAVLLGGEAPAAALLVSTVVFFLVRRFGRPILLACLGGTAAYFLLTPVLVHAFIPAGAAAGLAADPERVSWAIRLDIWRYAAERVLERPFVGWGLDASRMFPAPIQLHPHNGALQLWLELGAVGAGLAALFWAWLFSRLDRVAETDRPMAAAAAATACVYLIIGALSFGIWQEWWIALGALAAAVCAIGFTARRAQSAEGSTLEGGEPQA